MIDRLQTENEKESKRAQRATEESNESKTMLKYLESANSDLGKLRRVNDELKQ